MLDALVQGGRSDRAVGFEERGLASPIHSSRIIERVFVPSGGPGS